MELYVKRTVLGQLTLKPNPNPNPNSNREREAISLGAIVRTPKRTVFVMVP